MHTIIALVFLWPLIYITDVYAEGHDYTGRKYLSSACELFAADAYQAAGNLAHGISLKQLLNQIDSASVSDSEKDRAFQAIQLVWNNQLDNPLLAYSVAMGLCLQPKQTMAPMDEPWVVSPRTISGHY